MISTIMGEYPRLAGDCVPVKRKYGNVERRTSPVLLV